MTLQLPHALTKAFKQYIIGFENHYCVCIFSITKKIHSYVNKNLVNYVVFIV